MDQRESNNVNPALRTMLLFSVLLLGLTCCSAQQSECDLKLKQCPTGQWIAKNGPNCEWQKCAPLNCTNGDDSVYGCTGKQYQNKCEANEAKDYCDMSIKMVGQDAILRACPYACLNRPKLDICPIDCIAKDETCACAQSHTHEYRQSDSLSSQVASEVEALIAAIWAENSDVMEVLEGDGQSLEAIILSIFEEAAKNATNAESPDMIPIVLETVKILFDLTDDELQEVSNMLETIFVEKNTGDIEKILKENDGETVEAKLKIPGEAMSPWVSIVGDKKSIRFDHGNQTDYARFHLEEIKEIDSKGQVVQSWTIDRLLRKSEISVMASDINLGSDANPKQALEIILAYPMDNVESQCPNAEAFAAADTIQEEPTLLLRVYLIGRDGVQINYMGDPVTLEPFSLKYTIELDNWPMCDESNKLKVSMLYKFSRNADDIVVEDIVDMDLDVNQDLNPESVTYETLISEQDMNEFEDELEDLMVEDEFFQDKRRKLLQRTFNAFDFGSLNLDFDRFDRKIDSSFGDEITKQIRLAMQRFQTSERDEVVSSIQKLKKDGVQNLDEDDKENLRDLIGKAKKVMYSETRKVIRDELRHFRRQRYAIATSLKMMRRKLRDRIQSFKEGKMAAGFAHTLMFMPSTALIGDVKTNVDVVVDVLSNSKARLEITFPSCADSCVYDPTIAFDENATIVAPPKTDSAAFTVSPLSVFGLVAILFSSMALFF